MKLTPHCGCADRRHFDAFDRVTSRTRFVVIALDYSGDFGVDFPQNMVNPRSKRSTLLPDIVVCFLLLNVEIEDVMRELPLRTPMERNCSTHTTTQHPVSSFQDPFPFNEA
jgi:hypothetical protein